MEESKAMMRWKVRLVLSWLFRRLSTPLEAESDGIWAIGMLLLLFMGESLRRVAIVRSVSMIRRGGASVAGTDFARS